MLCCAGSPKLRAHATLPSWLPRREATYTETRLHRLGTLLQLVLVRFTVYMERLLPSGSGPARDRQQLAAMESFA